MPLFWSVERERDTVLAICPEPLRAPDVTRPAWMEQCAAAIRDELRLLPVAEGTLLAATMTGEPGGAELESALLSHRGIPQAHVHDGVRFALLPPAERGVVLRYRREPIAAAAPDPAGALLATLLVPVTPAYALEAAQASWARLARRRRRCRARARTACALRRRGRARLRQRRVHRAAARERPRLAQRPRCEPRHPLGRRRLRARRRPAARGRAARHRRRSRRADDRRSRRLSATAPRRP